MLQWEIFYTPTVYFHCSIHTLTLRPSYSSESIKFTVKLQWLNLGYCGKKYMKDQSKSPLWKIGHSFKEIPDNQTNDFKTNQTFSKKNLSPKERGWSWGYMIAHSKVAIKLRQQIILFDMGITFIITKEPPVWYEHHI